MEKVLFIIPPCIKLEDFLHPSSNARFKEKNGKIFGNVLADMPIGVLSLSSYIKKHTDVESKLLDFNIVLNKISDFNFDSFISFFQKEIKKYKDFNPTIICISTLFSPAYRNMVSIGEISREIFPETNIFAGGGLPTNMYKEIFKETNCFTALCYGEGELPLLDFIQNKEYALEKNSAWITKEKVNKGNIFSFQFIENLDEIPFYDYELCGNISDYGISPTIIAFAKVEEENHFHVMTSRGCNFHCTFCSSHTVHGRKMRYFSIDRVKEDFTKLKELYNAHTLIFQDDHFLADEKRALQIIEIIKELNINVIFQNGLALYGLNKDMLLALKSAGIDNIVLAVESGSQRVLNRLMNKPLTLKIIKRVTEDCKDLDIYTDVNIIIGMPDETKQDIQDARDFLKTIKTGWFRVIIATPIVGSDIYNTCIEKGYIDNFTEAHYKKAVITTPDFTPEWLEEMQYIMNLELNFVYNSDYNYEDYKDALNNFLIVIEAKSDHAFAYYYASKCYKKLGDKDNALKYINKAKEFSKNIFWEKYINMFNIKELRK